MLDLGVVAGAGAGPVRETVGVMSIVGDDHLDILEHPETEHMSQAGTSKVSVGCHGGFDYDQSRSE
jgi:hypothetical protein